MFVVNTTDTGSVLIATRQCFDTDRAVFWYRHGSVLILLINRSRTFWLFIRNISVSFLSSRSGSEIRQEGNAAHLPRPSTLSPKKQFRLVAMNYFGQSHRMNCRGLPNFPPPSFSKRGFFILIMKNFTNSRRPFLLSQNYYKNLFFRKFVSRWCSFCHLFVNVWIRNVKNFLYA